MRQRAALAVLGYQPFCAIFGSLGNQQKSSSRFLVLIHDSEWLEPAFPFLYFIFIYGFGGDCPRGLPRPRVPPADSRSEAARSGRHGARRCVRFKMPSEDPALSRTQTKGRRSTPCTKSHCPPWARAASRQTLATAPHKVLYQHAVSHVARPHQPQRELTSALQASTGSLGSGSSSLGARAV